MTEHTRRFRLDDGAATRVVFAQAVQVGASGRYTQDELLDWMPDPAMPDGWATWLDRHLTMVAEAGGRVTGFMMVEADGYLNMAFVLPERMGKGTADALYAAILLEAQRRGLMRMTVLASRYARGFFARRGWVDVAGFAERPDLMQHLGPQGLPMNWPMALVCGG